MAGPEHRYQRWSVHPSIRTPPRLTPPSLYALAAVWLKTPPRLTPPSLYALAAVYWGTPLPARQRPISRPYTAFRGAPCVALLVGLYGAALGSCGACPVCPAPPWRCGGVFCDGGGAWRCRYGCITHHWFGLVLTKQNRPLKMTNINHSVWCIYATLCLISIRWASGGPFA